MTVTTIYNRTIDGTTTVIVTEKTLNKKTIIETSWYQCDSRKTRNLEDHLLKREQVFINHYKRTKDILDRIKANYEKQIIFRIGKVLSGKDRLI